MLGCVEATNMHPDLIEEMEYQANARYDYLNEAYGETARDAARMLEQDYAAEMEEARNTPWVREARFDDHAVECVGAFLGAVTAIAVGRGDHIWF
jgi:hypothetical protein